MTEVPKGWVAVVELIAVLKREGKAGVRERWPQLAAFYDVTGWPNENTWTPQGIVKL